VWAGEEEEGGGRCEEEAARREWASFWTLRAREMMMSVPMDYARARKVKQSAGTAYEGKLTRCEARREILKERRTYCRLC
jgi:hypothetical protein